MGVPAHPQLRDHPLELVRICSSSLGHEEASAGLQLQAPRGAHQGHPLEQLAVHKQRHGRAVHTEGEARPLAGEGGQTEAGGCVGPRGPGLGVQQLDVLVPITHARQPHAHGHHHLGRVRDGKQHPRILGGRPDVEVQ